MSRGRNLPTFGEMDLNRIPAGFLPRAAAFASVAVLATVGLGWVALLGLPHVGKVPPLRSVKPPKPIVVPDVRREAFVFDKGELEDAGFAWRVSGKVHGYAANTVVAQSPAAGTKVYDTGAPLVTLKLSRNATYQQQGVAEDVSPYASTAVEPAEQLTVEPAASPSATKTTASLPPAATTPAATTPAATTPAATTPAATKPVAKPATHAGPTSDWPKNRTPDFVVPGAKKEPLDEMPLVDRARMLGRWVDAHPTLSSAEVHFWLYQNAWVVTGARFGWWHGAAALRVLIAVDRHADQIWGIGPQTEAAAQQALAFVQTMTKSKE